MCGSGWFFAALTLLPYLVPKFLYGYPITIRSVNYGAEATWSALYNYPLRLAHLPIVLEYWPSQSSSPPPSLAQAHQSILHSTAGVIYSIFHTTFLCLRCTYVSLCMYSLNCSIILSEYFPNMLFRVIFRLQWLEWAQGQPPTGMIELDIEQSAFQGACYTLWKAHLLYHSNWVSAQHLPMWIFWRRKAHSMNGRIKVHWIGSIKHEYIKI